MPLIPALSYGPGMRVKYALLRLDRESLSENLEILYRTSWSGCNRESLDFLEKSRHISKDAFLAQKTYAISHGSWIIRPDRESLSGKSDLKNAYFTFIDTMSDLSIEEGFWWRKSICYRLFQRPVCTQISIFGLISNGSQKCIFHYIGTLEGKVSKIVQGQKTI